MDTLLNEIKQHQANSSILAPSDAQRAELLTAIEGFVQRFYARVSDTTFYPPNKIPFQSFEKVRGTDKEYFEQPHNISVLLQDLDHLLEDCLNAASGGHLAYIPAGGIYYAALGDYLADVLNKYSGIHSVAPKAIEMENHLIDFVCDGLIGYTGNYGGNITSGGSQANLTALVAARDKFFRHKETILIDGEEQEVHNLNLNDLSKAVVFTTELTHHCVQKALRIAGLNDFPVEQGGNIFYIQTNAQHKLDTEHLEKAILECQQMGKIPWMVVASAGTTSLGTVDDFEAIAHISEHHNLWFHIDAAYGGFFTLLPEMQSLLKGMERADSVVLDAHKSLFFPYGIGMVVVKEKEDLLHSFYYKATYISESNESERFSPANVSSELTRPFRGLKMWLGLSLLSKEPFAEALREKNKLSIYAHQKLSELPNIICLNEPELSTFAFRYEHPDWSNAQNDAANGKIYEHVKKDGTVYLSPTIYKDKKWMRVSVLSFRTHLWQVDKAVDLIVNCEL